MNDRFSRFIDRFQYFGILFSILLVPLIFYVGNQNIVLFKSLSAQLIVYFLFALWMIDSLEKGEFTLIHTFLDIPIVAFLLWIIFTIFASSPFWFYSAEELGRFTCVFLLYFLIQKTFSSFRRLKWGLWILFLVSILTTSYGYLQFYGFGFINWGKDVLVSTFGNQNFFTGFLVLIIPVIVGYALATKKWIVRIVLFILAALNLYILMATGTRTGFLGFLVGFIFFVLLYLRFSFLDVESGFFSKKLLILATFVISLGIGVYLSVPQHLIERMQKAVDLQRGTGRVRWVMWTGASRAAQDQPLMGHGQGVFQLTFPFYRPRMYHRFRVSHNTRHSHNEYLEILMETGTVGLALFLLIFVLLGIYSYRFLKRNDSRFFKFLVIGLLAGIVGSLAQNFASVNLRWMSSTFSFWFILSLIPASMRLSCSAPQKRKQSANKSINRSYKILPSFSWKTIIHPVILLVPFGIGLAYTSILMADFALKDLQFMIRATERQNQGRALIPIHRWEWMTTYYDGMDELNTKNYQRTGDQSYVEIKDGWQAAATVGKNAISYNPFNLSALYKLGFVHLSMSDYESANETYSQLTDIAPNYAQIHNNMAIIRKEFDQPFRALLHFEWATWLEDNYRNHQNLMRRYRQKKMTQRSTLHSLDTLSVNQEELRDEIHRIRVKYHERPIRFRYHRVNTIFKKNYSKYLKSNYYQSNQFRKLNQYSLSKFTRMNGLLRSPLSKATLREFLKNLKSDQVLNSNVMLSFVRRLRTPRYKFLDGYQKRLNSLRKRYTQTIFKEYNEDGGSAVDRLVIAELYTQLGQSEKGWSLIKEDLDQLKKKPLYRDSIEYIKSKLDREKGSSD